MGNYLHRTTKQYLQSWSPNDLPEALANYIEDPDLSTVVGVPSMYWIITGDVVSEMNQSEKDVVDTAIVSASRDAEIQAQVDNLESTQRQVLKLMIAEINILRQQINTTTAEGSELTNTSLTDRTLSQVKTQIRNDLGS
jgi:hypothetical protein